MGKKVTKKFLVLVGANLDRPIDIEDDSHLSGNVFAESKTFAKADKIAADTAKSGRTNCDVAVIEVRSVRVGRLR